MILLNVQDATVDYLLTKLWEHNPGVIPKRFMSDQDPAQLNSIVCWYSESLLLLCWWHMLHTNMPRMQQDWWSQRSKYKSYVALRSVVREQWNGLLMWYQVQSIVEQGFGMV